MHGVFCQSARMKCPAAFGLSAMHAKFVAMIACGCLQSYYVSAALCKLVTHLFFCDVQSCMMKTFEVCLGTLSC